MPTARQIAVLSAAHRVVRQWPIEARIAFQNAVLADVSAFSGDDFSLGEVLTAVHQFAHRWANHLPWPPPLPVSGGDLLDPALRAAIGQLADLMQALGASLALACGDELRSPT